VLPDRSVQTVYPANGNFDVVVVQSTSQNAFPEGAGILVGKPIYTVYLHVGSGKDWILQYCATPSTAPAQPNGQVVNLADSMGIQPPYPISTTMPVLGRRAKYLLVRGVLGANGRFRNLKLASEAAGITQLDLFRYLETWSFRPVTQAARPIDVEALLAIPPS
jgi:hypothetical protein